MRVPPRFGEGFTNELFQLFVSFLSALSCFCFSFCVNGSDMSFCVLADASVDAAL